MAPSSATVLKELQHLARKRIVTGRTVSEEVSLQLYNFLNTLFKLFRGCYQRISLNDIMLMRDRLLK